MEISLIVTGLVVTAFGVFKYNRIYTKQQSDF